MDGDNSFKPVPMYAIMAWRFSIWYIFQCCSEWRSFFECFQLFFHVAYPFGFSFIFSSFLYFAPNIFPFIVIRSLVSLRAFSRYLLVGFFSRCFGFVYSVLSCLSIFFDLLSFASTFWFIFSSCIVYFRCVVFTFRPNMFKQSTSVLSFSLVVDFLSAFPVEFPLQVLSFCSCSLEEHWFYHRLISLLHRLV